MNNRISCFYLLSFALSFAHATLPSMGTTGALDTRSLLPDSAFVLSLKNEPVIRGDTFSTKIFNLSSSPAIGEADVQFQMAEGTVYPGELFVRHFHPRSSEVVYVLNGRIKAFFDYEWPDKRRVSNTVRKGEWTVIPQGLIHNFRCISKVKCDFLAIFRTADPGLIIL